MTKRLNPHTIVTALVDLMNGEGNCITTASKGTDMPVTIAYNASCTATNMTGTGAAVIASFKCLS